MANKNPVLRGSRRLVVVAALLILLRYARQSMELPFFGKDIGADIESTIQSRAIHMWVETEGRVLRLLPDDHEGAAHQRFILRLDSGRTVLVADNIAVASRVPLQVGDVVRLRGRYEWNDKGGVIHWTHHDPGNRHSGGWIECRNIRYR